MSEQLHFLYVGDANQGWHQLLEKALVLLGNVDAVEQNDITERMMTDDYAMIIIDASMVDHVPMVISSIQKVRTKTRIIVVSASPTWTRARDALKAGAVDYVPKSVDLDEIVSVVREALLRILPS